MKIIAKIYNGFDEKFGVPRQSGLIDSVISEIVFEKEYRNPDALRGIENFSHIWVLWRFQGFDGDDFSPTVRPPRLGGNKRIGVFATRSPHRPNPIGLSCLKLLQVKEGKNGKTLICSGADMVSGTEIYDIKPYLPFTDCVPDACGSYAEENFGEKLKTLFPDSAKDIPDDIKETVAAILNQDIRPAYQQDENRIYGFSYSGYDIKFKVSGDTLYITDIVKK